MKKKIRMLSATPRKPEHSRQVIFSMSMREKISEKFIARRASKKKKKR